jgi:hypothetical protein
MCGVLLARYNNALPYYKRTAERRRVRLKKWVHALDAICDMERDVIPFIKVRHFFWNPVKLYHQDSEKNYWKGNVWAT